ncbi:MAG: hypothetical protein IT366_04625 [Candidatus Hydrogenedentes bacterium]|nr:hypothetical protein [Candidatus Hydrogenedentota bacterium]
MFARTSILVILVAACACSRAPQRDLFKEGETLYLDGKYSEAADVLKQRLIENPDDAGAHYYLGNTYMSNCIRPDKTALSNSDMTPDRWLGIAQGELEVALELFKRQGKVSPIPRFDATYFEMMCHVTRAKIHFILLQSILDAPPNPRGPDMRSLVPGIIKKCAEEAEQAEKVSPDAAEVRELKELIKAAIADTALQRPAPPAAQPTQPIPPPAVRHPEVPALAV